MERRMLLAVGLSVLVMILYSAMFAPRPDPEKPIPEENGAESGQPGEPGRPAPGEPTPEAPDEAGGRPAVPLGGDETLRPATEEAPLERAVLSSEELEVGFTTQGGAVEFVRLQNSYEVDKETLLDLIVPEGPHMLLGQIDLTGLRPRDAPVGDSGREDHPAGALRRARWQRDAGAEALSPEADVVFVLETEEAIWRKRWILADGEGRYDVRVRISRQAKRAEGAQPVRLKVLAAAGLLREGWTGAAFQYPNTALYRKKGTSSPSQEQYGFEEMTVVETEEKLEKNEVAGVRLLGTRSHYYLSTWYTEQNRPGHPRVVRFWATGEAHDARPDIERSITEYFRTVRGREPDSDKALRDRIRTGAENLNHAWMIVELDSGTDAASAEAAAIELPFYSGPISRHVLRAPEYAPVKPVISYIGAFDILAGALLWIYDVFRSLLGNAGIAVILMTIVVRGLMMPISVKNQLSMRTYSRKIAKLKPELDKLKKKFGNNQKRMREEQAKLYREHGVGFPAGCLMMLIQIPVFFALFSSLRSEYTLRNAPFLWIRDLGAPDKLVDFGKIVADVGVLQIFSLNILPLLMVGLSLYHQRQMPKPADEQQAQQMRMMKWLPVIFAVILYNYTAALALYMVLSSAVSIVESRIVRAKDPTPDAPGAVATPMM